MNAVGVAVGVGVDRKQSRREVRAMRRRSRELCRHLEAHLKLLPAITTAGNDVAERELVAAAVADLIAEFRELTRELGLPR